MLPSAILRASEHRLLTAVVVVVVVAVVVIVVAAASKVFLFGEEVEMLPMPRLQRLLLQQCSKTTMSNSNDNGSTSNKC